MVSVTVSKKKLLELSGAGELGAEELSLKLEGIKAAVEAEEGDELTLEVTSDRPDLLGIRGVARALKGALGVETGIPKPPVAAGAKHGVEIFCEPEALNVRPVVVGAVVEGARFSEDDIARVFQMQEKLDLTVGRKRKRVSIGLYDLSALKPPFYFKAFSPEEVKFTPLKAEKPMTLKRILEEHPTGKEYARLINKHPKYPVLVDSKGEVLSLVPVINNITSAVTASTNRFFIDHTGTDAHACNACLNIICGEFAEAGATVTRALVRYPDGRAVETPDTAPQKMKLGVAETNRALGTTFSAAEVAGFLAKQRISAKPQGEWLDCEIPAYRADFMHPVDLVEEVAMGFGYNSFKPSLPNVYTKGGLSELTYRENFARDFLAGAGFLELNTPILTSEAVLEKAKCAEEAVEIINPVSDEYAVMRPSLVPAVLDVLSQNTHAPYPQKLFEVGEVVVHNPKLPERMETKVHAVVASAHADSGITEVASVVSEYVKRLGEGKKANFEKSSNPLFLEGRSAEVWVDGRKVGIAGEVHPAVLGAFEIQMPVAVAEFVL